MLVYCLGLFKFCHSVYVHYQDLCSVSLSASLGPQVHSGKQSPALSSVFEPQAGGSLSPHSAPYKHTGRHTEIHSKIDS